ncbi:MAG: carboxypeptidase-like regulatory domain-containing protein [Chloroflexota bacterium]
MKRPFFFVLMLVILMMAGCGPSAEEAATMTAAAWTPTPPPTATPTFTPTPIPFDLLVKITDPQGNPIPGAAAVLPESGGDSPISADDGGLVGWNALPGESGTLSISAQGYLPAQQPLSLARGPNEVTVVLERDPYGLLPVEACAAGEQPVYVEDFQDGKGQGWPEIEVAAPGWKIQPDPEMPGNTMLTASKGVPWTFYDRENTNYGNVAWRLRYRYTGKSTSHLNFRFVETGDLSARYMYVAGVYSHLQRMQNSPGVGLGNFTPLKADEWHLIELGYYDGVLSIWLDGKEVITYQDPQPWEGGSINLEPYPDQETDLIYFDNLAVCELSAPFQSIAPAP